MEKIVQRRLRRREEAIREAVEFVKCVAQVLDVVAAWLFGSYARGDFNEWSDIDVIIVLEQFRGVRLVDRYLMLKDIPEMWRIEPILWTPEEAQKQLSRVTWRYALCQGHMVIVDDFGLTSLLKCHDEAEHK